MRPTENRRKAFPLRGVTAATLTKGKGRRQPPAREKEWQVPSGGDRTRRSGAEGTICRTCPKAGRPSHFVAAGEEGTFNRQFLPLSEERIAQHYGHSDEAGRRYSLSDLTGEGVRHGDTGKPWRGFDPTSKRIEKVLGKVGCVAIRIDKEHPIADLVNKIKEEIERAKFIIADLTDERPSCYFEAGYAEARGKKVIYVASKESVINPKTATKIHFDIHMNVNSFVNHDELGEKLLAVIEKNRDELLSNGGEVTISRATRLDHNGKVWVDAKEV